MRGASALAARPHRGRLGGARTGVRPDRGGIARSSCRGPGPRGARGVHPRGPRLRGHGPAGGGRRGRGRRPGGRRGIAPRRRHRTDGPERRFDADRRAVGARRGHRGAARDVRLRRPTAGCLAGRAARGRGADGRDDRRERRAGGGFVIDAGAKILAKDVAPFIAGPRRGRRLPRRGHPAASTTTTASSTCRRAPADRRSARSSGSCPTTSARSSTSSTSSSWPRAGASSTAGPWTRAAGTAEALAGARPRSWATPAASRIAASRATGMAPSRRTQRPLARAVDDGRRRPAARRSAVEDEVDAVAELGEDLGRVARLGQAGDVGRGGRQRPDGRGERPGRVVVRDAQADRRRPAGQDVRQRDVRALRERRRSARPASTRRRVPSAAGVITPIDRRLGRVVEQQHDPLVGRPPLDLEQPLDAARRVERDRDPVDRVGRQRDDAAAAQDLDRPRPDRPRRRRRSGRVMPGRGIGRLVGARRPRAAPAASSASRSAAARASAGGARTSASIIRATPSSASGGAT